MVWLHMTTVCRQNGLHFSCPIVCSQAARCRTFNIEREMYSLQEVISVACQENGLVVIHFVWFADGLTLTSISSFLCFLLGARVGGGNNQHRSSSSWIFIQWDCVDDSWEWRTACWSCSQLPVEHTARWCCTLQAEVSQDPAAHSPEWACRCEVRTSAEGLRNSNGNQYVSLNSSYVTSCLSASMLV